MISARLTALLALTAGVAVANIYYAQPMVALIAASFHVSGPAAASTVTAAQLGYAAGIVLLIPLGDRMDRRRVMLTQCGVLMAALVAAGFAPDLATLDAASILIGAASSLAQHAVPFAADLAAETDRGRVVGRVMSGLLSGILLARVLSGAVGEYWGWRAMFLLGAGITALLMAALWRMLPHSRPATRGSYGALLASLVGLWRQYGTLRRAAIVQGCLFGSFSAFWSVLALLLEGPPYHLGAATAGLFGVVGLAGVLVAPVAGRMADRRGAWIVALAGLLLLFPGWASLALVPGLAGIAVGVVLLDAGIQATLIANQTAIYALAAGARSRVNTVFVTGIFLGGALGSAGSELAWATARWPGVLVLGAGLSLLGLAVHGLGRTKGEG